jgi:hypothetical protein
MRWAGGRDLVALAICDASEGVTVDATAGGRAIEVSNGILMSYTNFYGQV